MSPSSVVMCSARDGPSSSGTAREQPMQSQKSEVDAARDPAVDAILLKEQQDKTNRGPKYTEMQVCFPWG